MPKLQPTDAPQRKRFWIWIKWLVYGTLFLVVSLVIIGAVYQAVGQANDKRQLPPPGQMVEVGGYRMHISCQGEGEPTIILEALSGGSSSYWAWVQPKIAEITRVCAYDRAGRSWSEPRIPTGGSYAQQTVEELRTLLENADVPGPYILVGHSIGGVYARQFIESNPDQVVGLVLLDASHPDQFNRIPTLNEEREANSRQSAIFPWLARLGLFRLFFARGGELDFQDLPAQQHKELISLWSSPRYFESLLEEMAALPETLAQAQTLGNLGDLPLVVITAGDQVHPEWFGLQNELASLSSNNLHITMPEASHASLVLNPQHAEQVGAIINQMVAAARAGKPLAAP